MIHSYVYGLNFLALSFSREKPDVTTLCTIGRRLLSLNVMLLNFNFGKTWGHKRSQHHIYLEFIPSLNENRS